MERIAFVAKSWFLKPDRPESNLGSTTSYVWANCLVYLNLFSHSHGKGRSDTINVKSLTYTSKW